MAKFRCKTLVDAIQYTTGNRATLTADNTKEVVAFCGPECEIVEEGIVKGSWTVELCPYKGLFLKIQNGDWIVKTEDLILTVQHPERFADLYEEVTS